MDKHPNQYLNDFVATYVLHYLSRIDYKKTGSQINQAAWNFLERSGINPNNNLDLSSGHYLTLEAAHAQMHLTSDGQGKNVSWRQIVRDHPHLKPLVAHGPQALLLYSYLPLLENLFEVDNDLKEYGYGKDVYREIVNNVRAARLMFADASKRIAQKIFEQNKHQTSFTLFEGGAGNGAASLDVVKIFWDQGKQVQFLLSDLDEATKPVAEDLFRSQGHVGQFPWTKVDLCNVQDLKHVSSKISGTNLVIMINFIVHENKSIAETFFGAVSKTLPEATLAITEFFLPTEIDPKIPEWFIFLHGASGQFLRNEKEFLAIASQHGYRLTDRLDHQVINGQPLISTLFLKR